MVACCEGCFEAGGKCKKAACARARLRLVWAPLRTFVVTRLLAARRRGLRAKGQLGSCGRYSGNGAARNIRVGTAHSERQGGNEGSGR